MQDFDANSTQSLIDKYYQEEQKRRMREKTQADIPVKIEPVELAMVNMIARRFNKSREELIGDILSSALVDLFSRIEGGERKLLARDADEATRKLAREIAEENGLLDLEVPQGHWANVEKQLLKAERKRAKDLEKQQELLAKAEALLANLENQAMTEAPDTAEDDVDAEQDVDLKEEAVVAESSVAEDSDSEEDQDGEKQQFAPSVFAE